MISTSDAFGDQVVRVYYTLVYPEDEFPRNGTVSVLSPKPEAAARAAQQAINK